MAFDAFISYSHAADDRLAPALQRAIQRLAKPWYRARALRVFRDESALSANPHLWSSIQTAMDDSEWFVLLASPDATASEWVNRELTHWLSTKSADRILVVLTDGTLAWDGAALTGTAVPTALRDAFADEPRHVDLRWAATETDLDMHHARFRDVVAQLAAPMHGIAKDELDSEDVRQHRRAQRLARGGVTILTLLVVISLVATTFAIIQRQDAVTQRVRATKQASEATAQRFAALAVSKASGSADQALVLGVEGYERFNSPTTRAALLATLASAPQHVGFLPGPQDSTTSTISPDEKLVVAGTNHGSVRFWDPASGESKEIAALEGLKRDPIVAMTFSNTGKQLFVLHNSGTVETWNPATRTRQGEPVRVGSKGAASVVASSDDRTIAVTGRSESTNPEVGQRVALYDAKDRRNLGTLDATYDATFSTDGSLLYAWQPHFGVVTFDVRTRKQVGTEILHQPSVVTNLAAATDSSGRRLVAVAIGPQGCTSACGASLVDADNRQVLANFSENVNAIAINKDASEIVTGNTDGTVTAWSGLTDITSLQALNGEAAQQVARVEPAFHQHASIRKVTLSPTGNRVVSTAADGATRLWDVTGVGALATGPETSTRVNTFALSPSGRELAAGGQDVRIWKVNSNATGFDTRLSRISASSAVTGIQFEPSGSEAIFGDTAYRPGAEPHADRALARRVILGGSNLSPYAFASSRAKLTSTMFYLLRPGSPGLDKLDAIDVRDGHTIGSIRPSTAINRLRRAHPGAGPLFAVGLTPKVDTRTVLPGQLMIDPRGRRAVTISVMGDVIVWDLRTGAPVAEPLYSREDQHLFATAVAFSPDGQQLAVGRTDGSVSRYLVPTLQGVGSGYHGHAAAVGQVAFQPHGSLLAIASAAGVDLLDLGSGDSLPLISFNLPESFDFGLTPPSGFVQFDASGTRLLTPGYVTRRAALFWSMVPNDWAAAACRSAGRNLTRSEWEQIVGSGLPYHRTCSQWPAGT